MKKTRGYTAVQLQSVGYSEFSAVYVVDYRGSGAFGAGLSTQSLQSAIAVHSRVKYSSLPPSKYVSASYFVLEYNE